MRVAKDYFVGPFDDALDRGTNLVRLIVSDDVAADF